MAALSPHDRMPHERPLGELFSDLWRETSTLVHDEAELLRIEMSEKAAEVKNGAIALAAGGMVLFAGFIVLLFAAVGALDLVIPSEHSGWLSPLIVGLAVMIVGAVALSAGLASLRRTGPRPERALRSLREDARMLKEHVK
jgi:hypothetical protein